MFELKAAEKEKASIALVVFIALFLRLVILFQGLTYLDRMFLPDDAYYMLSISRNIAENLFPSADGKTLTSGFQPLSAFLIAPFFSAGASADDAVIFSIFISAVFGSLACGLFAKTVFDGVNSLVLVVLVGLIAATSPLIIRNDMNGLETSLAMFLSLGAISAFTAYSARSTNRNLIILGVVIGLMILARVDNAFLAALIGAMVFARVGFKKALAVSLVSTAVVAPWWIYCAVKLGSPVPESGMAVRQLIEESGSQKISMAVAAELASAILLQGVHIPSLMPLGLLISLLCFGCGIVVVSSRLCRSDGLILLISNGLLIFLFYVIYLPAFWFFNRYVNFSIFAFIACSLIFAWVILERFGRLRMVAASGAAMFLIALNIDGALVFLSKPEMSLYGGVDGAKGYREIALDILSKLPDGVTLGAQQSGALGYYADRNIRVVNLDGVVNKSAYDAIRAKKLSEFIFSSKIDYIAGWSVNMYHIELHSAQSEVELSFKEIARFKGQGIDQFSLFLVCQSVQAGCLPAPLL
jgi:hypothetical protein